MANNEEKLMSELTFDEILEEIIKIDDMRMESYYREIEKEEALQEIMDTALSEGITIETEPQLSKTEALILENMIFNYEGQKDTVWAFGQSIEPTDKIINTYLHVKSQTTDSGGRVIDAHRWKGEVGGKKAATYEITGVSPWVRDLRLTHLLSAAGYDYRED